MGLQVYNSEKYELWLFYHFIFILCSNSVDYPMFPARNLAGMLKLQIGISTTFTVSSYLLNIYYAKHKLEAEL